MYLHCVLNLRYSLVCNSIISKGCTSSSSDDCYISNVGFSYARTEETRQLTFFKGSVSLTVFPPAYNMQGQNEHLRVVNPPPTLLAGIYFSIHSVIERLRPTVAALTAFFPDALQTS